MNAPPIDATRTLIPATGITQRAPADGLSRGVRVENTRIGVTAPGARGAAATLPSLAAPEHMDAAVMLTLLYTLRKKQSDSQVRTAEVRIDQRRTERQDKHEEIVEKIKKAKEAEKKGHSGQIAAKVFGWIGVGLAWVMVGVAAVVSGGAAAIPLAVGATAMTAFMIAQETGATDKAIEAMHVDEKTAMGIQIGMAVALLVVMIAATIVSAGAGAGGAASSAANIAAVGAETGASATAEGAAAGAEAGAAASEIAATSAELASTSTEVATSASEVASSSAEIAASTTAEAAETGAQGAGQAAEAGNEAAEIAQTTARSARLLRIATRLRSLTMVAQGTAQAGGGSAQISAADEYLQRQDGTGRRHRRPGGNRNRTGAVGGGLAPDQTPHRADADRGRPSHRHHRRDACDIDARGETGMNGVAPASGGQALAQNAVDRAGGMIRVGGVPISANDAARLLMMHRTEVMKEIGETRTELAENHLDKIRKARGFLTDLRSLEEFTKRYNYKGRVPTTPDMLNFLKNEVGADPGAQTRRFVFRPEDVPVLPESVRHYYALNLDRFGTYKVQYGGQWGVGQSKGKLDIYNIQMINHSQYTGIREEVNNYIDQLNDSNNLFMTKFKNVVNTMNEALESANSMEQKEHETMKALVSKW